MEKATILIVDDEENVVRSLSRTLRDQYHVLTATSGEAALEIAAREDIAVILTDQRMPGLTGVQLLERAKKRRPNTVGILISGYSDVTALMDALNVGVVRGYIPKPWDTEELRQKLNSAVQQFEAVINEHELLHSTTESVVQAREQMAEFRKIFDLVSAGEIGNVFSNAEGKLTAFTPLTGQLLNREFLDHLSDGFALIRENGTIDYCNSACRKMLALDYPTNAEFFSVPRLRDCAPLVKALQSAFHGSPGHAEFFLINRNGDKSYLEAAATPIVDPNKGNNAVIIVRDQTERQQNLAHLKGLSAVTEAIVQTLDFDQGLPLVLAACCEAVQADGCYLYFVDAQTKDLHLAGAIGLSAEMVEFLKQNPLPMGKGLTGQVALTGEPNAIVRVQDATVAYPAQVAKEHIVSTAMAPLRDQTGISGVIGVTSQALRKFSDAEIKLLSSIGSQVGMALRIARLLNLLREQAHIDGLTGLFNRRYFMELAEREYARSQRHHSSLVALMLDMDRFKQINDGHGHAIGDQVLQAVGSVLAAGVRSIDLVCRYGGDEFAALLPHCEETEARQVIERLQQRVSEIQIPTASGAISVGVSIGSATASQASEDSLDALFIRADARMYEVKTKKRLGQ